MIPTGAGLAIGIPGAALILIATLFGSSEIQRSKAETEVVQTIFSPDKKLQAIIKQRRDGKFQVETWKVVDYIQDSGPSWARQGTWGITDTLANAVEIAESYIRKG